MYDQTNLGFLQTTMNTPPSQQVTNPSVGLPSQPQMPVQFLQPFVYEEPAFIQQLPSPYRGQQPRTVMPDPFSQLQVFYSSQGGNNTQQVLPMMPQYCIPHSESSQHNSQRQALSPLQKKIALQNKLREHVSETPSLQLQTLPQLLLMSQMPLSPDKQASACNYTPQQAISPNSLQQLSLFSQEPESQPLYQPQPLSQAQFFGHFPPMPITPSLNRRPPSSPSAKLHVLSPKPAVSSHASQAAQLQQNATEKQNDSRQPALKASVSSESSLDHTVPPPVFGTAHLLVNSLGSQPACTMEDTTSSTVLPNVPYVKKKGQSPQCSPAKRSQKVTYTRRTKIGN